MGPSACNGGRLRATAGSNIPVTRSQRLRDAHQTVPVYYVIGFIGQGSTSKVFHAIDGNSREVVIKMSMKRIKSGDDSRLSDLSGFLKKAKEITAAEVKNYREFPQERERCHT
jgi:hypothetical protein